MIIGICGKSGAGKSTLANRLKEYYGKSTIHVEIDKIGYEVLLIDEVKKELLCSFGDTVFDNSKVDRKKLGFLVFNSHRKMKKLSDITWNYMQIKLDDIISANKDKIIVLDWILLPSTKYMNLCDKRILLDVPYEVRLKRAIKRDGITPKEFEIREKASPEYKKADFDYIIEDTDETTLERLMSAL